MAIAVTLTLTLTVTLKVLLLHELERLLEATPKEERSFISRAVAPMLSRCLGSENSRIAERALTVFSTAGVREVLFSAYGNVVTQLMAALLRQGIPHWNSTVNKMTHEARAALASRQRLTCLFPSLLRSLPPSADFAPPPILSTSNLLPHLYVRGASVSCLPASSLLR